VNAFRLGPGRRILIYGASGAIGTAAVQLAKSEGAEVTAVVATRHLDLVKSLGADRAIDYTAGDFTRIGERFDVVFDAVGKASFFRCRRLLKPDGMFAATDVGPGWQNLPLVAWSWITKSNRVLVPLPRKRPCICQVHERPTGDQFERSLIEEYPLDAIADAYRCTGNRAEGHVVIDVIAASASKSELSRSQTPNRPVFFRGH
jgi:NADPH:quinone reductase-like Zn-dependent oxidoreductase